VVLDQGWDLLGFAAQAPAITGGNIDFTTMPTGRSDLPTPTDGDAIQVDPTQIQQFLTKTTGHPGPAPPGAPTDPGAPTGPGSPADPGSPAVGGPAPRDIAVTIRNASGASGLAGRVQTALDSQGFATGSVGNAATQATVIRYAPGQLPAARKVAATLGGLPVEPDASPVPGQVEVVLGPDYPGPGVPGPGVVTPDGSGPGAPAPLSAPPSMPAGPPISAAGVPCVN